MDYQQSNSSKRVIHPLYHCLCAAIITLASVCLMVMLAGLSWHFTLEHVSAQASIEQRAVPSESSDNFAPYLEIVPSQDGNELYIHLSNIEQPDGVLFANVGVGPSSDKRSYTMRYSETVQSFVATAVGLTPGQDLSGAMNITTTLGLTTSNVEYTRAFVPAATRQTLQSADGALELSLVNTDTLAFDTYVAIVPSYAPPGPLSPGHRLIGSVYSIRAAGALVQTDRPMNLRLYYDAQQVAGADPHTLAIFAWDAAARRWTRLAGRLFSAQRYMTVVVSRFTAYALMTVPGWRDEFDDFSGLDIDTLANVTLDGALANRSLVLATTPGNGRGVSTPITPTTTITGWGTLFFTATTVAPTTTLTVDVLSADGATLLTDLVSGSSLAAIDPVLHRSLRLRANLAASAAGQTPALDGWQLTWQVAQPDNAYLLYLPVVQGAGS